MVIKNVSGDSNAEMSIGRVGISLFRKVVLDDVYVSDQDKDTLLFVDRIVVNIDSISFKRNSIGLKKMIFENPNIYVSKNDSNEWNFFFLSQLFSITKKDNNELWSINCRSFELKNGRFVYVDSTGNHSLNNHFGLRRVNFVVDEAYFLPEEQMQFVLQTFSCDVDNGLRVRDVAAEFEYSDSTVVLKHFDGQTSNSAFQLSKLELGLGTYFESRSVNDVNFDLDVDALNFGFKDIAFLFGAFNDNSFNASFSGEIKGSLDDLRGKSVKLSIGDFTSINGDFYLNGLPDINSTYIFVNLNESYANLNEIRNLDLPKKINTIVDRFPAFFDNVGEFRYRGNFTGFVDNFVAYGTAYSNLGTIKSDVSFRPHHNEDLMVNGHISTQDLDIGSIFNSSHLDKLSLNGVVDGTIYGDSKYNLEFKGTVDSVDFNQYTFRKIDLNGTLENEQFNGLFSIQDTNLRMNYSGKLDLSPELPVFAFVAAIDQINLGKLNLINDNDAMASMKIDANFEGNSIDNVKGLLELSDIKYRNAIGEMEINKIKLENIPRGDTSRLTLRSDLVDGEVDGHYNFKYIGASLLRFYRNYLASSIHPVRLIVNEKNDFNYHFRVKDISPLFQVLKPELYFEHNFDVSGFYKPNKGLAHLETTIPFVRMGNRGGEDLKLSIDADSVELKAKLKTTKIRLNDKLNIYNFTIDSKGKNDDLTFNCFWNNYGEKTYSGAFRTLTNFSENDSGNPLITVNIEPSKFYFADSLWSIDPGKVIIDSTSVSFDSLRFYHQDQHFMIDGVIADNDNEKAFWEIKNVDFLLFQPLLGHSRFTGNINGNGHVVDFYEKMKMDMGLSINDLSYDDRLLGDLTLSSKWDNKLEKLASELILGNDDEVIFKSKGVIDPREKEVDLNLFFDHSPISILQVLMPSSFYNQEGLVKGTVHAHGKINNLLFDGKLTPVKRLGIGISYLKTIYTFNDPIYFAGDSIIFSNLKLEDSFGNSGILDGCIRHRTFNDMKYDLKVDLDKVLVMNTTASDNQYFYGTAFAKGTLEVSGQGSDVVLSGVARSEKGTNIFIPFESNGDAEKYDFIEFAGSETVVDESVLYDVVTSGLSMNFDVEMTSEAKVQIIFNSQMGDIIKGVGNGNLKVMVDKNYNINLYGNYLIEDGDYLFTLQNVINKRFSIERGSTISWIGNPYDALIDISAVYKVKTSLYDLFVGSFEDLDLTRRIPVDCQIKLSENLMQPKIDFSIDLPTAEERIKDEVKQLIATPEDVNKQLISLLMMGRFYTPEFFSGLPTSEASAELVGTTASELISNQLTNWLSKISEVWDLGVNYRPGNEISNDQIELALSTQVLNDRVTFNGNIANNANPDSENNNEIIGDFDLNIKLTDSGKFQFKVYNHSNDNLIYDTSPYTQGVGFTYREEFNTLNDLFIRFKEAIFRKKKGKVEKARIKKE